MKLLLLSTLLLFSISFSFAQNSTKARVLLAYNAFNSDKDTLQIGNTLSYNSDNKNELIFLEETSYLALMNENGSILEWNNREKGNYKIEFDESDDGFDEARKYLVKRFSFDAIYEQKENRKNPYSRMKKTGAISCLPRPDEIEILAEPKSNYIKDSLQIFVEYFEEYLREGEKIKSNTLKIEITDLRNNLIYSQKLDTTFFFFDWNNTAKDNSAIVYKFFSQTTKNRVFKSSNYVIKKYHKELPYQERYFQSQEKTAIGLFLQFLYSCEESELNIYSCQLYHEFLKQIPKEAHSIIKGFLIKK